MSAGEAVTGPAVAKRGAPDSATFTPGEDVFATVPGEARTAWHDAKIEKDNGDGTFTLSYPALGRVSPRVPEASIRARIEGCPEPGAEPPVQICSLLLDVVAQSPQLKPQLAGIFQALAGAGDKEAAIQGGCVALGVPPPETGPPPPPPSTAASVSRPQPGSPTSSEPPVPATTPAAEVRATPQAVRASVRIAVMANYRSSSVVLTMRALSPSSSGTPAPYPNCAPTSSWPRSSAHSSPRWWNPPRVNQPHHVAQGATQVRHTTLGLSVRPLSNRPFDRNAALRCGR